MDNVRLFRHSELGMLTVYVDKDSNEYFKAHDVCIALRLSNPSSQVRRNVRDKWVFEFNDGHSNSRKALYVSEPGLYALIFRAKTEQALSFQDWVFEEVLPKLRASGGYIMPSATSEQLQALQAEIVKLSDRNQKLTSYNRVLLNNRRLNELVNRFYLHNFTRSPGRYVERRDWCIRWANWYNMPEIQQEYGEALGEVNVADVFIELNNIFNSAIAASGSPKVKVKTTEPYIAAGEIACLENLQMIPWGKVPGNHLRKRRATYENYTFQEICGWDLIREAQESVGVGV